LHAHLVASAGPAHDIGDIGRNAFAAEFDYDVGNDTAEIGGARIPYRVEVWARCKRAPESSSPHGDVILLVNRSPTISRMRYQADSAGFYLDGCGLGDERYSDRISSSAKRATYTMIISLIAPYIRLMNDGKTPLLSDFRKVVAKAAAKAANAAYRHMARPPARVSIKDAAWEVMQDAYMAASDNGRLPANARQVMYAARPMILEMTGREKLDDKRFTQELLPDYVRGHAEECETWDVVFDARGHFVEPHTGRTIPLGTLAVRQYLGDRPSFGPARLDGDALYPTSGPSNRFRNVLFVEKEGFDPLLEAAQIAERFDLATMSTKGMSVTAARLLLDRLAPLFDRVFVLHDFDVAGLSILGTLGTDSRRYEFQHKVPIIDLGLRLTDVLRLGLESEPTEPRDFDARIETLSAHGATEEEIEFLCDRRVELNAMTSAQFIEFLEDKFATYGVGKFVPDDETIEAAARRGIEHRLTQKALDRVRDGIAQRVATTRLPKNLRRRVERVLLGDPTLPWDIAVSRALE
jgi:hypothetical protein